ncbi:hypothetical protein KUTeg_022036, partial [Tegillarca granosa]
MTVSYTIEEMTLEEKPESSHEYNYFLDRQLQNKLLSIDDESTEPNVKFSISTETKPSKPTSKVDEITGWTPSKIALRKPEKENKVKESQTPWINPSKSTKQQIQDNFLFRHYADYREYIEQYRQEHSCIAAMMSPTNRELNEMRKIAIQNTAPSQIQVRQNQTMCAQCNNNNSTNNNNVSASVQNLLTAALQYTNRKDGVYALSNTINNMVTSNSSSQRPHQCSKHSYINDPSSQSYKYKMSPDVLRRPESQHSVEVEREKTEILKPTRITSAKLQPRSAGKLPTKVTVPQTGTNSGHLKHQPLQTVTIQGGKENSQTCLYNGGGSTRTLDTLACVATDKQAAAVMHYTQARLSICESQSLQAYFKRKMWFDSKGRAYAEMQVPANLEGLTWCEKLEVLRSVNKRQEKRQHKIPKLRFVKDTPLQVSATPISKPRTARDQLYQQRRIKHLLMQARMKGTDQFDWLKESPRYRNSNSDNDSSSGDSDYGDHLGPHGKIDIFKHLMQNQLLLCLSNHMQLDIMINLGFWYKIEVHKQNFAMNEFQINLALNISPKIIFTKDSKDLIFLN